LPVVLTREEVERVLAELEGVRCLIASLLYGAACASWSACACG